MCPIENQSFRLFRDVSLGRLCSNSFVVSAITTSRNLTPAPRGCKIACKRVLFFDHGKAGYLTYWGPPPLCKQALTWAGGGEEIGAGGKGVATSPIDTHYALVFTPFNTSYPRLLLNVSCNFNSVNLGWIKHNNYLESKIYLSIPKDRRSSHNNHFL